MAAMLNSTCFFADRTEDTRVTRQPLRRDPRRSLPYAEYDLQPLSFLAVTLVLSSAVILGSERTNGRVMFLPRRRKRTSFSC